MVAQALSPSRPSYQEHQRRFSIVQQQYQEHQQRMGDHWYRHLNFAYQLFTFEQKYHELEARREELKWVRLFER